MAAIFDFTLPRGAPGNQGQIGDNPPNAPDVGDLWFDTNCPSGLYIWDGTQWVGTSTPGPAGQNGTGGGGGTTYTFNAPLKKLAMSSFLLDFY